MGATKIIIIPDIHGREFWRKAVENLPEDARVVFLGDYLDPYEDEWIYWFDAFQGLQDIIALKKARPEQVTLLLGNHDLHYMYPGLRGSRYNEYKAGIIKQTFDCARDAFQMAAEFAVGGKRYLFSHAGVHPDWVRNHANLFCSLEDVTADTFNRLMFTEDFVEALSDVSWRRGGASAAGSMIWADIYEYELSVPIAPDVVQICGHTLLRSGEPKEFNNTICVDCQRSFVLTEGGLL